MLINNKKEVRQLTVDFSKIGIKNFSPHQYAAMKQFFLSRSDRALDKGDSVYIRQDLQNGRMYGNLYFVEPMEEFECYHGKLAIIKEYRDNNFEYLILNERHSSQFIWTYAMVDWIRMLKELNSNISNKNGLLDWLEKR